ncbi:CLUMA_CG008755, isoform A [Clunio marinus]|uniref:CLUMA_CG008755, isoform A n=1 Tax=Clunio marinus TaxID=568069 RepID=A0A1J1I721_9DIPT|nr:CLUMA_CG008755, isoform A [Clunio marinus]
MILLLFIWANLFQSSKSAEITCDFQIFGHFMGDSIGWKYFYIFNGSLPRDEDIANITGINGEHLGSRNNADVEAIRLTDDWLTEIPSCFDHFFPNIHFFFMRDNPLKAVNSNQLQQFPNLEYLWLHQNQIETIEVNAFTYTPALRAIRLSGNKFKTIPYNAFQPLYLKVLRMSRNICINDAAETPEDVNKLIAKIYILCSPLGDTIQTSKHINDEIMPKQNDLVKAITDLQVETKIMNDEVLEMEGDVTDLLLKDPNLVENLENFKIEMDKEHENVNKRINSMEEIVNKIAIPLNKGSITRDYCSRRSEG